MALMIVAHPTATFSGVSRVGDITLMFIAGYTGPTELSSAQQTILTNVGFAVGATPPQTPPDPFPQYLTDTETAAAIANPATVIGAAGRAAYGTSPGDPQRDVLDASYAPLDNIDIISVSGSVVVPAHVSLLRVRLMGGGGGGGGGGSALTSGGIATQVGGGGGAAGTLVELFLDVTPGETLDIAIGAGGVGGDGGALNSNPGASGTQGATTTIKRGATTIASAGGGIFGVGGAANSATSAAAGSYGGFGTHTSVPTPPGSGGYASPTAGQYSGPPMPAGGVGGGGGGPATSTLGGGFGRAATAPVSGGVGSVGAGASTTTTGQAGANATQPSCGGGGGGAGAPGGAGGKGGNGAPGRVVFL